MDGFCHQSERTYFLRTEVRTALVACMQMRTVLGLSSTPLTACPTHRKWVLPCQPHIEPGDRSDQLVDPFVFIGLLVGYCWVHMMY